MSDKVRTYTTSRYASRLGNWQVKWNKGAERCELSCTNAAAYNSDTVVQLPVRDLPIIIDIFNEVLATTQKEDEA
tara:strand:- start:10737 stop:10961 length:225 start_codon:yes stop_codon:yes gene_type:complete